MKHVMQCATKLFITVFFIQVILEDELRHARVRVNVDAFATTYLVL